MILLQAAVLGWAQNPRAVIREMMGTVEIMKPGSTEWMPAVVAEPIDEAAIISTGFKSTALVAVGDSTVLVRALTRMSLEALLTQEDTETIKIGLNSGRIRVDVKPPPDKRAALSVQTPSATASVRGTGFDMDTMNIKVHEGSVVFEPLGGIALRPVRVNSGQETWVDMDTGWAMNPLLAGEINRPLPGLSGYGTPTEGIGPWAETSDGPTIFGPTSVDFGMTVKPGAKPLDLTITVKPKK